MHVERASARTPAPPEQPPQTSTTPELPQCKELFLSARPTPPPSPAAPGFLPALLPRHRTCSLSPCARAPVRIKHKRQGVDRKEEAGAGVGMGGRRTCSTSRGKAAAAAGCEERERGRGGGGESYRAFARSLTKA
ncbi:hypothetical protein Mp_4g14610 [Marchantia polymorpha subsp. ruderalis]|uniref:Uncharacterized protein n=2 Tax=Marchantia polymorpha TaxID=3197 RepID=A0AAF6B9X0_MARPO|nr:hypothetical protein MARPO_0070s0020 [Marchantia polymorpha]BBN08804.1 hypothetical protein Mp_4g14610 [Marchantia polymorpha subsp. ruderalis]|eukprot:PTQ35548.1 hypothetical protein MARPO_0070s0020 [Marchantia polymorpha]